jgi:DNA-binding winged helix-turn-helix (wHTH) protein
MSPQRPGIEGPRANAAFRVDATHERLWFQQPDGGGERFSLDTVNQCLWRHVPDAPDRRIGLTPKAFAVLKHLVHNAGRLVTHQEFLEAVWPGVYIQPEGLKSQILTLRSALEDDARNPRFIEALPRRGYRFIAHLVSDASTQRDARNACESVPLVGRDRPLSELETILQQSIRQRRREIVFVTGESGIGKTSLVDEFVCRTRLQMPQARIARGQCVEGYGGKEAYYPMLEALGELCRGDCGASVLPALACAPACLAQFPALTQLTQRASFQREPVGAARDRMLRELGDLCERLTQDAPLVLVFEDLQWIDRSTVDLIELLARSRRPMQLLLIGTYRPADLTGDHPLRTRLAELQIHRLCSEMPLNPLTEIEVAGYLAARAPGQAAPPDGLAGLIHRHTEGNPLFMVTLLAHLRQRGLLSNDGGAWQIQAPLDAIGFEVPETLRDMIEARIERLSDEEKNALEVASVLGGEFDSRLCAEASGLDAERMEELCQALAERHFILRRSPSSPPASPTNAATRYLFAHAMYRQVLYSRQLPARRARLHARVAHWFETEAPGSQHRLMAALHQSGRSAAAARHAPAARGALAPRAASPYHALPV